MQFPQSKRPLGFEGHGVVDSEHSDVSDLDEKRRPALAFVDSGPSLLLESLLEKREVQPVLIRFDRDLPRLSQVHLERTEGVPTFELHPRRGLAREAERFGDFLRARGLECRHFCNPNELRQRPSHRFAALAGLPAMTEVQGEWLRDKMAMKAKLQAGGIRVAAHRRVRRLEEALEFAGVHGWPLVLKPIDGTACVDTFKITSRAEMSHIDFNRRRWMLEAFLPGREYGCCALVYQGEVLDTFVSHLPAPLLSATDGAMNANISMRRLPGWFDVDTVGLCQRVVDLFELGSGYLHMELFKGTGTGCTVSEVAFRLAGARLPVSHSLAYGFDIFGALLDVHTARRPELRYTSDRFVGDLLLPTREGIVEYVTPPEAIESLPGVLRCELKVKRGQEVVRSRGSHVCSGYAFVEGQSVEEVERRMRRVLRCFELRTVPSMDRNEAGPKPLCA